MTTEETSVETNVAELPERLELRSEDIAADRREELLRVFPEVGTEDGKVDFEKLHLALGEDIETRKERYGLTWPGKVDCFKTIQSPSLGTLRPCPDDSVNFGSTENLIVEGDNLEVLKLLQKSYLGKIKMVYIDPPYNTGNDFIYPDDYTETLQTYLEYTQQVDSEGRKFGTNTDTEGRFHSKWLSMMYPRLYLARNLLRDDGMLFVTIDDGEVANLRLLCNEIFGEENFVANVVWQKKYTRSNDAKYFSDNHDHILVFARNRDSVTLNLQARTEEQESAYSNPDGHAKGPWKATPLHAKSGSAKGFSFTFKNGLVWSPPPGTYARYSTATLTALEEGDEIWFGAGGKSTPSRKTFLAEAKSGVTPTTIWPYDEVGHNHEANNELKALRLSGVFDNPKPTRLVRRMLELSTSALEGDLVLDFFSGSGTTGQAVLDQNIQDGGNRAFILVQLPEPTGNPEFPTIADITKARVRRAIEKVRDEGSGQLNLERAAEVDLGFRVFRLTESNFKIWNAATETDPSAFARQLELHVSHIREGRTSADILAEILLKSGFPLTTPVESLTIEGKIVFSMADGALLTCLDRSLTLEVIRAMAARKPERVVCLDEGFAANDQLKANAVQAFRTKGVASFRTV
jgi:adenine-specific DNA-methyltransferase